MAKCSATSFEHASADQTSTGRATTYESSASAHGAFEHRPVLHANPFDHFLAEDEAAQDTHDTCMIALEA